MLTQKDFKVIVKCPNCQWRIMDKVTPATGIIQIKCPRCGNIVEVDLSLRKKIRFRTTNNK